MRSINKVILVGNVTRDPELKKTLNQQSIAIFGVATNREWMTKDGRKQQSSEFHEVVCWGGLAEFAAERIKKGKLLYIEGYLKTRSWDDASGLKKFRTEVMVEDLILLDKRPKSEADLALASEPSKGSLKESDESAQPSITIEDPLTI